MLPMNFNRGSNIEKLFLESSYKHVTGIEENAHSIRYAVESSAANGITNTSFSASDAAVGLRGHKTGEFTSIQARPIPTES